MFPLNLMDNFYFIISTRFKLAIFHRHKRHLIHFYDTFTMAIFECHRKILCTYFRRLVSMVIIHEKISNKTQFAKRNLISGLTNNRLQAYCKHNLEHNIHVQNVLQILEASDKMNVPDIKKFALSMIVRDFAQVARLPKMRNLNRHLLIEIIEAMGDVVSELSPNGDVSASGIHSDI